MRPMVLVSKGSRAQRELVEEATDWYLKRLIPDKQLRSQLVLWITLKKNLFKNEGTKGDCLWNIDDEEDSKYPLDYEITIDASMKMHAILRTLAHECVHIRQFATGEMVDQKNYHLVKWRGKIYDQRKLNYFETPWELDAYGREVGLYENFVRAKKYVGKKWYLDTDY